jgi:hypothetical protein
MPDKFIVPQFIDKEDQILGPITVRQFLIMLGASLFTFIAFKILAFWYFVVAALLIIAFAAVFGFVKVNGQAFHIFFINFLQTFTRPALRVWNKDLLDIELREWSRVVVAAPMQVTAHKERPASSRLRDLSLVVNTGGVYKPDEDIL